MRTRRQRAGDYGKTRNIIGKKLHDADIFIMPVLIFLIIPVGAEVAD